MDTEKLFRLNLSSLRRLTVFFNTHYPLAALARNKTLGNLEAMSFQGADLDDYDPHVGVSAHITLPHLKAILASQNLGSLRHLGLRGTLFGDQGVRAILASGVLERWKTLDLSRGTITDAGALALAKSPSIQRLEWLRLNGNMLTERGIKALGARVELTADAQHSSGEGHLYGSAAYDGDME